MPSHALGIKNAYHYNSINNLIQSLEGMIKNPVQYSLADLILRLSIPCLWNSDFKEEGLTNIDVAYLKEYGREQRHSSVRERKRSCLDFGSSETCFKQTGWILLAIDLKDSSLTRFSSPRFHRNHKVIFSRCRWCVKAEVIKMSPCLWTSTVILVPFKNSHTVCML